MLRRSPKSNTERLVLIRIKANLCLVVTTQIFVGPDGKTYSVREPDEGGFFVYYDHKSWVLTFPVRKEPTKLNYYCGDELPSSARLWRIRELGARNPFPSFVS